MLFSLIFAIPLVSLLLTSHVGSTPLNVQLITRNGPFSSSADTEAAVRRALVDAAQQTPGLQVHQTNTTFDHSWIDLALISPDMTGASGQLESEFEMTVVCKHCYITGSAIALLSLEHDFNASTIVEQTFDELGEGISNLTKAVEYEFKYYIDDLKDEFDDTTDLESFFDNVESFVDKLDISDYPFPSLNVSFDMDVPAVPNANLTFRFEDIELYVELETTLKAESELTIPLIHANALSPISIPGLDLGVVFSIDLIFSVEGELNNMNSGLHMRLDGSNDINIVLFGDEISDIMLQGGKFEFLPVTIESANVVFTAMLRVGVMAGLSLTNIGPFEGGVEVGVYANVAEFKTNITAITEPKDDECQLQVVQDYSIVLGAYAGASVSVKGVQYGPAANATTAIYTTTMADICTTLATPATTPRASLDGPLRRRTDAPSTKTVFTGVRCASSMAGNCPVSHQSTYIKTEMVAVATPVTPIPFGSTVHDLIQITGRPTPYVAPPEDSFDAFLDDAKDAVRSHRKIAIGVGVGIGIPLVALIVGAIIFCVKGNRKSPAPATETKPFLNRPALKRSPSSFSSQQLKTTPQVNGYQYVAYPGT